MDTIIRAATMDDFESVNEVFREVDLIHHQAVPHAFRISESDMRSRECISGMLESEDHALFVAEHEGRIVGVAQGSMRETPDYPTLVKRRFACLENISVQSECRRQV